MGSREPEPMLNEHELTAAEESRAADSYGGVALGVECAWPESLPVIEELEVER